MDVVAPVKLTKAYPVAGVAVTMAFVPEVKNPPALTEGLPCRPTL